MYIVRKCVCVYVAKPLQAAPNIGVVQTARTCRMICTFVEFACNKIGFLAARLGSIGCLFESTQGCEIPTSDQCSLPSLRLLRNFNFAIKHFSIFIPRRLPIHCNIFHYKIKYWVAQLCCYGDVLFSIDVKNICINILSSLC